MESTEEVVDKTQVNTSEKVDKSKETESDVARFEGKVTPEQELSASVARRRRNISKKRSASVGRPRDLTPAREIVGRASSDEDETKTVPPKTPERRKSKSSRKSSLEIPNGGTSSEIKASEAEKDDKTEKKNEDVEKPTEKTNDKIKLISKETEKTEGNKENEEKAIEENQWKNTTKDEVSDLLNRAKQTITKEKSTRVRKPIKKSAIKRSQSAPREKFQSIENDLVESFKKAQLITAALELDKPVEKEFSSSDISSSSSELKPIQRPTYIPVVSHILQRRKREEQKIKDEEQKTLFEAKPLPKSTRITFKDIRQKWKEFTYEYNNEYIKINSMRNRCMNDLGLLLIFCGLGGIMFKFTEGTFENFYKCGVKRVKRDFIDSLWTGSHNLREEDWKSLARRKLRDFEEQLHGAHEAGVTSYSGQRSWSFLNAVVYALTIVTTIGYGHMYPTTNTGRALTIVYALIGIPLFLIILTDFGKLFTRSIKFLWAFVRRLYHTGRCRRARKTTAVKEVMKGAQMVYEIATFRRPSQYNIEEDNGPTNDPPKFPAAQQAHQSNLPTPKSRDTDTEPPETPAPSTFEIDDEFNLPISIALFLLISYIFLGAVVYYVWESWDFFASFYFVFISMSTIGFGDYVPTHPICMIVSIIYLVFGLALMSMCINVVQAKLSDTFRQASAKLGATIGLRVAEEDGSITTVPPPSVEIADVHASTKSI